METMGVNIPELIAENERLNKRGKWFKRTFEKYTFGDNHKRYYEKTKSN